jgi:hypothetical protein
MRKGMLIGAIAGFLVGLLIQARGSLTTGLVTQSISPEGAYFFAVAFGVTIFIASLCGIIGAFVGAILEEGMLFFKH